MVTNELHDRLHELSDYDRFVLDALLQQAAEEAGRPLSLIARQKIADDFFEERSQGKKAQMVARRKATMRKMKVVQAQAKTDFQWQPQRCDVGRRNVEDGYTPDKTAVTKRHRVMI